MQRAVNLLAALGATEEDGSLTDTGKRMTAFPLPPRLARLMVPARMNSVPWSWPPLQP